MSEEVTTHGDTQMSNGGPVEELMERYRAAVCAKDVDAFVALYDKDARVFDLWDRLAYQGTDEWRGAAAEWFGSVGSGKVAVEFHNIQAITGDDVAAADAFITIKGLSADGEELHVVDNRLTWVLRKTPEGAWKVIHEHTSAPVVGGTGKSLFRGEDSAVTTWSATTGLGKVRRPHRTTAGL
jgi:ketosteroid isomerase-like protein